MQSLLIIMLETIIAPEQAARFYVHGIEQRRVHPRSARGPLGSARAASGRARCTEPQVAPSPSSSISHAPPPWRRPPTRPAPPPPAHLTTYSALTPDQATHRPAYPLRASIAPTHRPPRTEGALCPPLSHRACRHVPSYADMGKVATNRRTPDATSRTCHQGRPPPSITPPRNLLAPRPRRRAPFQPYAVERGDHHRHPPLAGRCFGPSRAGSPRSSVT